MSNTTKSAFDDNVTLESMGITPYKEPYKVYRPKTKVKAKGKPKAAVIGKPKVIDKVQTAIDARDKIYKPYQRIDSALNK